MNEKPETRKITIEMIRVVYPALPDEFHAHHLFDNVIFAVKGRTGKRIYEQTVLREFQRLRQGLNPEIKCTCVNHKDSLYRKES